MHLHVTALLIKAYNSLEKNIAHHMLPLMALIGEAELTPHQLNSTKLVLD